MHAFTINLACTKVWCTNAEITLVPKQCHRLITLKTSLIKAYTKGVSKLAVPSQKDKMFQGVWQAVVIVCFRW
jgi:hypothetical protein